MGSYFSTAPDSPRQQLPNTPLQSPSSSFSTDSQDTFIQKPPSPKISKKRKFAFRGQKNPRYTRCRYSLKSQPKTDWSQRMVPGEKQNEDHNGLVGEK